MDLAQCTICQDYLEFKDGDIVAGICGHVFHNVCISQWRKNTDNCPQCRKNYGGREPVRLFFDIQRTTDMDDADPAVLQNKVRDLNLKVDEKDKEIKGHQAKVKMAKRELKGVKLELGALRDELDRSDTVNNALKRQLAFLEKHKDEAIKARHTAERLQKNLDKLQNVEALINGEKEDVDLMLRNFHNSSESLHQVITSFVIMKKEFAKLKESKEKMNDDRKIQRKEMDELRRKMQSSFDHNKALQDQLKLAETDLKHMEKERQNLLKKINALEQAFASPSPRASAIKRLLKESPAPLNAKRKRSAPLEDVENFESPRQIQVASFSLEDDQDDIFTDSFSELANEIGLKVVTTTSVANRTRKPASIENRKALTVKNQTQQKSLSSSSLSSSSSSLSSSSSCPVIQKGYNGLGGQSRFVKPSATKKLSSRVKVPKSSGLKNSRTIDQSFFVPKKDHPLPDYSISPP